MGWSLELWAVMSIYPKFPFSCYHFICSIKWESARKPHGRPDFHCLLPQTWPNIWPSQFPFLSSFIGYSGSRKVLEQVLVFRTWSSPPNPPVFSQRHHQMQTPCCDLIPHRVVWWSLLGLPRAVSEFYTAMQSSFLKVVAHLPGMISCPSVGLSVTVLSS